MRWLRCRTIYCIIHVSFICYTCLFTEGKNGDFRQETEEFERALAEVSRNEKLTAGETAYMSETDEGDELTKQIAGKIYKHSTKHLAEIY